MQTAFGYATMSWARVFQCFSHF